MSQTYCAIYRTNSYNLLAYRNSWAVDARVERWTLDAGLWKLDSRRWTLDAILRTLGSGHRTLSLTVLEQNQKPISDSA